MTAIVFPDTSPELPPHVVEVSGTGPLTKRLREYAALIEEDCGPSALTSDLREAAATLFAKLRRLDEAGLEVIYAEPVPEVGLGLAIMDRLRKAASK